MKNLFGFYVRALNSIPVNGGKADFRLVNAVVNEIIREIIRGLHSTARLDDVEIQCWADDTESPGASRYDVIVIKYIPDEVAVRFPMPLLADVTRSALVVMGNILNLGRVQNALGCFDSDEEREAREEAIKHARQHPDAHMPEDNNLLWHEFVGQYLSDEGFAHLSPKLQKILAEKVGKVRAKMLVTA